MLLLCKAFAFSSAFKRDSFVYFCKKLFDKNLEKSKDLIEFEEKLEKSNNLIELEEKSEKSNNLIEFEEKSEKSNNLIEFEENSTINSENSENLIENSNFDSNFDKNWFFSMKLFALTSNRKTLFSIKKTLPFF